MYQLIDFWKQPCIAILGVLLLSYIVLLMIFFSGIWPHKFRHLPQLLKPITDDVGRYLGILHDWKGYENDNWSKTSKCLCII